MSEREQFETAYRQEFGKRWVCPQRQDMFKRETNRYAHLSVQDMWVMWQAARAQPAQAGQVLTDDALWELWNAQGCDDMNQSEAMKFARAIEAAVLEKRVPMTREEVKDLARKVGYDNATAQERADFINGIRHAEVWHGIGDEKGGA